MMSVAAVQRRTCEGQITDSLCSFTHQQPHDLGSLAHLLSIRDKQKKGSKKDDGSGGQTSAGSAAGGSSGFGGAGGSHSGGSKKMTPIIQLLPPPPKVSCETVREHESLRLISYISSRHLICKGFTM